MPHTLSFDIQVSELCHEEDQPTSSVVFIEVRPRVNGKALTSHYVFDTLALLAVGPRDANFDLFTCECGHAGCAGIHDDVQVRAQESTVSWTFPEQPFRTCLNAELFPEGKPLQCEFSRAEYVDALTRLERALLSIEAREAKPVVLDPSADPDERHVEKLGTLLAHEKAYRDQEVAEAALYGRLLNCQVHVIGAQEEPHWLNPYEVLQDQAKRSQARGELSAKTWLQLVVPALREDNMALLRWLRALPWEHVEPALWNKSGSAPSVRDWPSVSLAVTWE